MVNKGGVPSQWPRRHTFLIEKIMKFINRFPIIFLAFFAQFANADTGPFYISYPGYCNVRQVYLNGFNDVYGTEVGCPSLIGAPVIGSFTVDGKVIVSTIKASNQTCINVYHPNGLLTGGCSSGGPITYPANGTWTVRADAEASQRRQFNVQSEMPTNMDHIRNLPPME